MSLVEVLALLTAVIKDRYIAEKPALLVWECDEPLLEGIRQSHNVPVLHRRRYRPGHPAAGTDDRPDLGGMLFSMALTSMALAPFSKYMLEVEKKWFAETNTLKKGWFAAIIWMALSIWVLLSIFAGLFS